MNHNEQRILRIEPENLIPAVRVHREAGFRLVQIGCAKVGDCYEITYSFDKDLVLEHIRISIRAGTEISSISMIYLAAFVYENEIADLYGIPIQGIVIDYKGKFITTSVPHPFKGTVSIKKGESE